MKKIVVINGGHPFAHSQGKFNATLFEKTVSYFTGLEHVEVKSTQVQEVYDAQTEVEKFQWADLIIYHTPIWWFQVPFGFKKYLDEVFTAGHQNGMYTSDGRTRTNPDIDYGTGGLLNGKQYIVTTSWNAPKTAFTLPDEFFKQRSVDDGVLFGFHKMNAFVGMECLDSHHFHDMEKNADVPKELKDYTAFLDRIVAQWELPAI